MKIDILAFGAHPDDVELGCSATLLKCISQGKKVVVVDLTQGELGTRGTQETRAIEANNASEILGITERINLKFPDGFFENSKNNQLEIIKQIRKFQPELVFCNSLNDRHPDHGKAAKLVLDACFLSGLPKIKTEVENQNQNEWRPKNIYHYIQWNIETPDFLVDVTGFEQKKLAACLAYSTQFHNDLNDEKQTPISTKNFKDSILYRMKDLGRIAGVEYAEGFISHRKVSVKNIFDLS